MKNIFCIIVFAFFISNTAFSQKVKYGVKGGMNISKFTSNTNSPFAEYTGNVGFLVGGMIEISLAKDFAIQPELLYSLQGTNINSGERRIRLNYLQLPILAKYYIVEGLSAEAGPVFDYLLSAKFRGTLISEGGSETIDVTDNYKSIQFGFGLGASYKLKSDIVFGLRYNFGVSDINDNEFSPSKTRNNVFQVSAGYFF